MISVKEIIIVEGAYDKIKLSSFVDAVIFVTGGFSIMTDKERLSGLAEMTKKSGAVILTDSDSAGFRIRSFLKQYLPVDKIKHAYIPDVLGKERRKQKPGAEGLVGVEGMDEDTIYNALKSAGCTINNTNSNEKNNSITKYDLYALGLYGGTDSAMKRKKLLEKIGLPSKMSSNMLCDYLSRNMTLQELTEIVNEKTSSQM